MEIISEINIGTLTFKCNYCEAVFKANHGEYKKWRTDHWDQSQVSCFNIFGKTVKITEIWRCWAKCPGCKSDVTLAVPTGEPEKYERRRIDCDV